MREQDLQNLNEEDFIKQYKETEKDKYEKPSVTTDMAIFTVVTEEAKDVRRKSDMDLRLLMIQRGGHPYKGDWALAGGFMNIDEDLDTAVQRELKEETGVSNVYAEQLYTWSAVNRDPRMRILSASYLALVDHEKLTPLQAGDDAEDVAWFSVRDTEISNEVKTIEREVTRTQKIKLELFKGNVVVTATIEKVSKTVGTNTKIETEIMETNGIAFDHAEIIMYSLDRLRGKINYTNIVFNLVGDTFTLPDLQNVYEIIIGKKLNKVQFRRHVEDMVIDTGEVQTGGAYRPSKLYRYNTEWEYGLL